MKRLFAAILALCLLALPACGDAPVETTPMATTPTPTTPAPTTPAPTTPASTPADTTPASTTSGDMVVMKFYSIEDLNTYMRTQSTDPEDYKAAPMGLYMHEIYRPDLYGYISLQKLFHIEEREFELFEIMIDSVGLSSGVRYTYCLDHARIIVETTQLESLAEYLNLDSFVSSSNQSFATDIEEGMVLHRVGETDISYYIRDGKKAEVTFMVDNFAISVRLYRPNFSSADKWYAEILENPAFSDILVLLSDDEQTVMAKMAAIKTAVESNDYVAE
ncbi:MAG: hypothetical protein J6D21_09345 [Clostridia bacterium]|nr:hypothetical protein [Clostridia bacterium]